MDYTESIVVPTYNRPYDLGICLESIARQSRKPFEVIVVDDGDLGDIPQFEMLRVEGIECVYSKKDTPGVCASRNLGAELARGDVVFYLDDDVELTEGYVETIMEVFESDPEKTIGGVGGLIIGDQLPRRILRCLRYLVELLFMNNGFREGRFLRSGFSTDFGGTCFPLRQMARVEFLSGGVCAYRREIFNDYKWSTKMKGRAFGEDKDFGMRIHKRYRLFLHPHARLYHYESPIMRYNGEQEGYDVAVRTYEFFNEHIRKKRFDVVFYYYAMFGYLIITGLKALLTGSRENYKMLFGVFKGIRDVAGGKVSL